MFKSKGFKISLGCIFIVILLVSFLLIKSKNDTDYLRQDTKSLCEDYSLVEEIRQIACDDYEKDYVLPEGEDFGVVEDIKADKYELNSVVVFRHKLESGWNDGSDIQEIYVQKNGEYLGKVRLENISGFYDDWTLEIENIQLITLKSEKFNKVVHVAIEDEKIMLVS